MPSIPFEEILAQAKRLPREDQARLVAELSRSDRDSQDVDAPNPAQPRSLLDALQARGLVGFLDGPPDLSTNPKYMEGFGRDAG